MPPGRWTALFFLDEATALAAGHRPCAYCRRANFISFAECWRDANGLAERPRATHIDSQLHAERVDSRTRRQLTRTKPVREMPDGVMVRYRGMPGLLLGKSVLPWSFDGYGDPIEVTPATEIEMLTPPVTVATIAGGYRPFLHPSSAGGAGRSRLS